MVAPAERSKDALRRRLVSSRAARTDDEREAAGASVASHLLAWPRLLSAGVAAAYLSFGDEPPTGALVDGLHAAGVRVLVPRIEAEGALTWAPADGELATRPGRIGVREPTGPAEPDGLAAARVLLLPGLAVDRRGVRIGRGAGYYDRALTAVAPEVPRVVVLFAEEVLPAGEVPAEPHDQRVTHAVTPDGLLDLG